MSPRFEQTSTTTATLGPTSDEHGSLLISANLVETYSAVYHIDPDTTTDEQRRALQITAGFWAFQWLVDNGLADGVELHTYDTEFRTGVTWIVDVGHGTTDIHPASDPVPDGIDASMDWVWSARWTHWSAWFMSMLAKQRAHRPEATPYTDTFERPDGGQLGEAWTVEPNIPRGFIVPPKGPLSAYGTGPSPFDDPEAYADYVDRDIAARGPVPTYPSRFAGFPADEVHDAVHDPDGEG